MPDVGLWVASFVAASSVILLAFVVLDRRKSDLAERLGGLTVGAGVRPTPAVDTAVSGSAGTNTRLSVLERRAERRLQQDQRSEGLRARMAQAGFYQPYAARLFLTVRVVSFVLPIVGGWLAGKAGLVSPLQGVFFGLVTGGVGTLAPIFWLDHLKQARQTKIRREIPDAFDVMTVCLRGGLSLAGTFSRITHELAVAHPMLAVEFHILERQVQMGRSTGEAVRELARRFDLEELRSMSSVIIQTERLGSSIVTAFEVFSDTLRQKRQQHEEMAQKASIKLLFPTLLFIFPGIFFVILGPAAVQIYRSFAHGIAH